MTLAVGLELEPLHDDVAGIVLLLRMIVDRDWSRCATGP